MSLINEALKRAEQDKRNHLRLTTPTPDASRAHERSAGRRTFPIWAGVAFAATAAIVLLGWFAPGLIRQHAPSVATASAGGGDPSPPDRTVAAADDTDTDAPAAPARAPEAGGELAEARRTAAELRAAVAETLASLDASDDEPDAQSEQPEAAAEPPAEPAAARPADQPPSPEPDNPAQADLASADDAPAEPARTKTSEPADPPAAPDEQAARTGDGADYKLSGIMKGPDGATAIINGYFVTAGQTVDDATVVAVDKYTVTLELNGRRFTIRM